MQEELIKFLVKVLNEDTDKLSWEHLCYAPKELYLKFLRVKGLERFQMADFVSSWAREDFNIELPISTYRDIAILRELVLDKYSNAYPHLLRKSETDRQGWMRVWVSTHMEKELQKNG